MTAAEKNPCLARQFIHDYMSFYVYPDKSMLSERNSVKETVPRDFNLWNTVCTRKQSRTAVPTHNVSLNPM